MCVSYFKDLRVTLSCIVLLYYSSLAGLVVFSTIVWLIVVLLSLYTLIVDWGFKESCVCVFLFFQVWIFDEKRKRATCQHSNNLFFLWELTVEFWQQFTIGGEFQAFCISLYLFSSVVVSLSFCWVETVVVIACVCSCIEYVCCWLLWFVRTGYQVRHIWLMQALYRLYIQY